MPFQFFVIPVNDNGSSFWSLCDNAGLEKYGGRMLEVLAGAWAAAPEP